MTDANIYNYFPFLLLQSVDQFVAVFIVNLNPENKEFPVLDREGFLLCIAISYSGGPAVFILQVFFHKLAILHYLPPQIRTTTIN